MGLFGKKKIPDGIRVMYYEGELNGFQCNFPCQILLTDDVLRITKINPYVEVKLDRTRISSIDIFGELEYMSKFKGVSIETSKSKSIHKSYFVINYISKSGEKKQIVFWGTSVETIKVMKMREEFAKNAKTESYEI